MEKDRLQKRREYNAIWHKKNPHKIKEYNERNKEYQKEWRRVHAEEKRQYAKNWYHTNKNLPGIKEKLNEEHIRYTTKLRNKLLDMYGGKCLHCGCSDKRVLQLDHVYGGGRKERNKYGGNSKIVVRILKGELCKENYQLLCCNCNWIKRLTEYKK